MQSSKSLHIGKQYTALELNGGKPCILEKPKLLPDLFVRGGARFVKECCFDGDTLFKEDVTVQGNLTIAGDIGGLPQPVVLDSNGVPEKYPIDLSKGVWYGLNTKANAFDASCVTIGQNAATFNSNVVAIGTNANANSFQTLAVGANSFARFDGCAFGIGAQAGNQSPGPFTVSNTALGNLAVASGTGAVAVGNSVTASGTSSIAIGTVTSATGDSSIAISGQASNTRAISIGGAAAGLRSIAISSTANADYGVGIGFSSFALGLNGVAVGRSATASGIDSVSIGRGSNASQTNSVAIGQQAIASHIGAICLGSNTTSSATASLSIASVNPVVIAAPGVADRYLVIRINNAEYKIHLSL